jgi:hypothetical protein
MYAMVLKLAVSYALFPLVLAIEYVGLIFNAVLICFPIGWPVRLAPHRIALRIGIFEARVAKYFLGIPPPNYDYDEAHMGALGAGGGQGWGREMLLGAEAGSSSGGALSKEPVLGTFNEQPRGQLVQAQIPANAHPGESFQVRI